MRIVHLDSGREMRGGQWQALRLIEGLGRAGVECLLLAAQGSPLASRASAAGMAVEPLRVTTAARAARHADLLHAHDARCHTIGAALASHRLIVSRRVAFPVRSRCKYRLALHYIAISEFVKHVLMEGGVPARKISVVYDGVPLAAVPARGERVIAPLTNDPRKGADLARAAAETAGIPLHGSSDLENDVRSAALLVYITRNEGLGSGLLLAMAAGVPVVASRIGGIPEIVRDQENGLLVENHPDAIAAAMRRVVMDRALAERLGAAGRRTVEERFSVDRMVAGTLEVYQRVLG